MWFGGVTVGVGADVGVMMEGGREGVGVRVGVYFGRGWGRARGSMLERLS